jgi:nucleoid-associated protein YgaU
MDAATKVFGALVDYQVGEVTAAATFYIAEIYANFGQSLRDSERPADLGGDALKDYDRQLAEAARPLEEKSVAVHEKNLELMRRGLYNDWTQKSLDRLAALKPASYARTEISSGFLGSLERYVYRPPPRTVQTAAPAVAQAAAPGQADSTAAAGPAGAGNAVAR